MVELTSRLHLLLSLMVAVSMGSLTAVLLAPIGGAFVIVTSSSIALISFSVLDAFSDKTITLTPKKLTRLVWLAFAIFLGISLLSTMLRKSGYISHWLIEIPTLFIWLFFPGFFILGLLDRKEETPLLLRVILSWPLSALLVVLFAMTLSRVSGDFNLWVPGILGINTFLFIVSIWQRRVSISASKSIAINELLFLTGLAVFSISSASVIILRSPRVIGDMTYHMENALALVKSPLNLDYSYPSAFSILLAALVSAMPLDPVLVYDLLFSLVWLLPFSLYLFMSLLMRGDKILAMMGTILSIFSGFGGLVLQLVLGFRILDLNTLDLAGSVTAKTYDVIDFFALIRPNIVAPIWIFGIPLLFTGLSILRLDETKNALRIILLVIITSCVIIFYIPYFPFFIAGTLLFLVTRHSAKSSALQGLLIGEIVGLLIDLIFLRSLILQSSIVVGFASPRWILFGGIFLTLLLFILSSLPSDTKLFSWKVVNRFLSHDRFYRVLGYLVIVTYVVAVILYLLNFRSLNAFEQTFVGGRNESIGYWNVPLYVEPLRLGMSGVFATLFLFRRPIKLKEDLDARFLGSLFLFGLIGTQLLSLVWVWPAYRVATVTVAGAGGLGALLIQNWLHSRRYVKFAICTLVLSVGLFSAMYSMMSMFLQFGQ